jgi:gamma-glutamylaminecyclotransferase
VSVSVAGFILCVRTVARAMEDDILPLGGASLVPSPATHPFSLSSEEVALVFVYGSLLRGLTNHHRLERPGVRFLGHALSAGRYLMCGVGFPILSSSVPDSHVRGEVYAVPADVLASLDVLEGHPDAYVRREIDVHMAAADAGAGPSWSALFSPPVRAWVYFGDVFWALDPPSAFAPLKVPGGDFRAFWEATGQTGWNPGGVAPHPLPIDEPVVVLRMRDGDGGGEEEEHEGEHEEEVVQWLLESHGATVRFLGACTPLSGDSSDDAGSSAASSPPPPLLLHAFFVPPRVLVELDRRRGHVPGAESAPAEPGHRRTVTRVRIVAEAAEGESGRRRKQLGPKGTTDAAAAAAGGASAHASRGAAPLDWVPGGSPVRGDVLHAFRYEAWGGN